MKQSHGAFIVELKSARTAKNQRVIEAAQKYLVELSGRMHEIMGEIEARNSDLAQMEERYRLINAMLETLGCAPQSNPR